jgi:putative DNA primase/helicase
MDEIEFPAPPEGSEPIAIVPSPDDPMAVARAFLRDRYMREDDVLLRHHRGSFHRWTGTCWPEDEERRVKAELYHWLELAMYEKAGSGGAELAPFKPNAKRVGEVAQALAAIGHVAEALDRPCWLDNSEVDDMIAMSNGLLRLSTRTLEPHRPALFNEHALPFAYDPDAGPPTRWLRFLKELWGDDEESIACLAEVMGYVLAGETNLQKIFMLVGPMRSGKGTIGRVLTGLLGAHNVGAPTLAGLTQNFGLQGLIGKPVALVSDARLSNKADGTVAVERLLSISGEDVLTVDRKYRDHWTGRLPSRFLILTNELPRFTDASGALASRFIVLVLTESFLGRENPRLTDELLEEAPAIFNWCLEGFDRLRARGHFQEPTSSVEAMRYLSDLASPVSAFVRDRCEIRPGGESEKDELFKAYKEWCESEGMKPETKAVLIRDLKAAYPEIKQVRPRVGDKRRHLVRGLQLKTPLTTPDHPHQYRGSDADHIPDHGADGPTESAETHPGPDRGQGWSGVSSTVSRNENGPLTDEQRELIERGGLGDLHRAHEEGRL